MAEVSIEEREAAICPEDMGFEEHIKSLQKRLTIVTAERNELNDEYNEEVDEFNAGFQAYKDSLPESTPHEEHYDVWLCGYAWAAFEDLKRERDTLRAERTRIVKLMIEAAENVQPDQTTLPWVSGEWIEQVVEEMKNRIVESLRRVKFEGYLKSPGEKREKFGTVFAP